MSEYYAANSFYKPLVVPFGFFVNKGVTVRTCTGGTKAGEQCSADSHCPGSTCGAAATITGISRMQAVQIFSGQVTNWTDFGAGFADMDGGACLRHAGSGTQATLEWGGIRGNGWGSTILAWENEDTSLGTIAYFNDKTSDMMNCINGKTPSYSTGHSWGGIGYADADQSTSAYTYVAPVLKYNGYAPTRANIRNGLYDNFWTALFATSSLSRATQQPQPHAPVVADMMSYAAVGSHIPSSKTDTWATAAEMRYMKADDSVYPTKTTPTDSTQTP
jgi:hypothetical protein